MVVIHLYFNSLSAIATDSSLIIFELFPACSFCGIIFILSQCSIVSSGFGKDFSSKHPAMMAGDLNNLLRVFSLVLLLPQAVSSKYISFPKSIIFFYPIIQQDQDHCFYMSFFPKALPAFLTFHLDQGKFNKLSQRVTGIVFLIERSLTLFDLGSFISLN